ncbi:SapC family protein [Sphingomonas sp. Leaf21]|uniref:SapC family protein n=1 Tax=Sphingomonas sp. Leaf21 TaxID=2876550 RepID=UPI001E33A1D3|nr:SapC family protein [Sphingomonas sp. Leaf21]
MTRHAILTAEAHRDLRILDRSDAMLGDAQMCCVTVPTEFRAVQAEYPILFRMNPERDGFHAFAMFGFENGENLYLSDRGWDARYRPLAMTIQPFLIGGNPNDDRVKQVHVDLDSPRIATGDDGIRVFDDHGRATPYLDRIAEQLGDLDQGYRDAAGFFAAIRRYDLLEPFSLEVTLDDGSTNRLVGFHIIDEDRLAALDGAAVAELHAAGHLEAIYMAIASLSQWGALIARRNRRMHRD